MRWLHWLNLIRFYEIRRDARTAMPNVVPVWRSDQQHRTECYRIRMPLPAWPLHLRPGKFLAPAELAFWSRLKWDFSAVHRPMRPASHLHWEILQPTRSLQSSNSGPYSRLSLDCDFHSQISKSLEVRWSSWLEILDSRSLMKFLQVETLPQRIAAEWNSRRRFSIYRF